jgi:PTH1 family peptidyl-tRNA hydrolase
MKLIIGLGNPGPEYAKTRHNIGFMTMDEVADEISADWKLWGPGKICEMAEATSQGEKLILLRPQTYMNLSGQAAVAVASYYKILPDEICVIHDEVDLPFGEVRLKVGGGDAGHNGLKSLTKCLSSNMYSRIRMGVGRSEHPEKETADHVLSAFGSADWTTVDDMIQRALQGVRAFAAGPDNFLREMNSMNKRPKKE